MQCDATDGLQTEVSHPTTDPHVERDRFDYPTGARFYRCPECGAEALTGDEVTHRDGCPHGRVGR